MSFAHLHVHSEYSLLDGFSNIKKLVQRAKEMGMPAIGLTDHGTMFGVIDFYNAAVKEGIKPVIGVEAYLAARGMQAKDAQLDKKSTHLLLLAENQTGYQNLLKLASAAQLNGFYYYPRIDHELLAAHSEGLICTSGCMSAEVPRLIYDGRIDEARRQLDWYYEVFGAERFFLELQSHDIKDLEIINKHLLDLGRRYEAQFVATNDVHYINPEDARLQDIMLAIQTGCVLTDPNRMRMTDNTYYLRTPEEMQRIFAEIPGAISNSLLIAERCNVDLSFKGYHLPEFDVPEGKTPQSYLRELCQEGLSRRYGMRAEDSEVRQRLDYELDVIHKMGFDTYFLIVWDLCRYAREQGIWYNARGSAAGSIVAYTLDITLVDPLEHGLIFERFLNPGRISMPDIDLDFRDDRRAEMLEYTARKYGDDKVAQIITFGTLGARAAIRDVGRVMDVPLGEVDRVAKMIPNIPGNPVTIPQALEQVAEFRQAYESATYLKELIDTASKMEGVVRNAGTHAAGVIITDKPIIEYVPLHRPTGNMANESPIKTVTQFEMTVVDSLGLLKVDFLGLATLTIMARACDLIYQRHGVRYHLGNIPTDDPATYELLGRGDTAGVFQVEGTGMRRWLMEMKPTELKHVIAMVALFRPGPMDFIPGYIRRMHGEEQVVYRHPLLEDIFNETYGYPVYQEQLMFAAMKLAGYTPPEADDLRKAIAKKMGEKLAKHRQKFIDGCVSNNIPADTAAEIFDDWQEFARYGFNKSHAVDYGVIAVQTAYLKLHYPVEYMTALLSVTKNDTAKVALYVADCRRMGIAVEPPDIRSSDWDFTIEDRADKTSVIRYGLGGVKNVGQGAVQAILNARQESAFRDLNDFARRVDLRQVGRRSLEFLIKVGALDCFGPRLALLEALDRIIAVSAAHFRAVESGQMSLFGFHNGVVEEINLPRVKSDISRREVLNWERELIGQYISDHPLSPIMADLEYVVTHYSGQLSTVGADEKVRLAGIITHIRHHQSRAGKPMAFISMEDLQGSVEMVVFPRTWEKVSEIAAVNRIVLVEGRVDSSGGEPKILVDQISAEITRKVAASPSSGAPANDTAGRVASSPAAAPRSAPSATPPRAAPPEAPRAGGDAPPPPEIEATDEPLDEFEDLPPMPEPPDWDLYATPAGEPEQEALPPEPHFDPSAPARQAVESDLLAPTPMQAAGVEPAGAALVEVPASYEDGDQPPAPEAPGAGHTGEGRGASKIAGTQLGAQLPVEGAAEGGALTPAVPPPSPAGDDAGRRAFTYLVPPQGEEPEAGQVRMLTVVLRASGDRTRDVLRLRRIHRTIISYPGNDRFAIHIFERGKGYLMEFPNATAGITQELLDKLIALVGAENVRAEPIVFH